MARYMATASMPKVGLPPSHVPIPTRAQRIATLHWAPRSGADDAELNSSAEEMVQQLLNTDPETLAQMSRVKDAARRVAELQMEQARLARALAEAEENDEASAALRERRAEESSSALLADAEVKAAALRLQAAELEAKISASMRDSVALQADNESERIETGKAGAAAAVGGSALALSSLLVANTTPLSGLLALGGATASAFLFGLVYRYAVRTDLNNTQLKGGVVAAFGLVRGLAEATAAVNASTSSGLTDLPTVDVLGTAVALMGQSMLLFAFASVSLEFALRREWVQLFGRAGAGSKVQ